MRSHMENPEIKICHQEDKKKSLETPLQYALCHQNGTESRVKMI